MVSDEGLNFSGAMYPGGPLPTAGFNERLGWAYTVNAADISDTYRLTFDHPTDPLKYRYGSGYRDAEEWSATIHVLGEDGELEPRQVVLRRSHYGPIIAREDDGHYLAVRVPRLYEGSRMVQALAQAKARTFEEWYAAVSMQLLQTFNTTYADADGNIFYLYNGAIARRDPSVDWTRPVDGADPNNEWGPFHPVEELPQVLNPPSGYVQNCQLVAVHDHRRRQSVAARLPALHGRGQARRQAPGQDGPLPAAERQRHHLRGLPGSRLRHDALLAADRAAFVRAQAQEARRHRPGPRRPRPPLPRASARLGRQEFAHLHPGDPGRRLVRRALRPRLPPSRP